MCLLVLTPQMSHLNLNTDTRSLSEQSTSFFVSYAPAPAIQLGAAGLKVTSQINKAQMRLDVLTLIHLVGLVSSSKWKWELNAVLEEVRGKLRVPPPSVIQQS